MSSLTAVALNQCAKNRWRVRSQKLKSAPGVVVALAAQRQMSYLIDPLHLLETSAEALFRRLPSLDYTVAQLRSEVKDLELFAPQAKRAQRRRVIIGDAEEPLLSLLEVVFNQHEYAKQP